MQPNKPDKPKKPNHAGQRAFYPQCPIPIELLSNELDGATHCVSSYRFSRLPGPSNPVEECHSSMSRPVFFPVAIFHAGDQQWRANIVYAIRHGCCACLCDLAVERQVIVGWFTNGSPHEKERVANASEGKGQSFQGSASIENRKNRRRVL
jgi:hypothetical protein